MVAFLGVYVCSSVHEQSQNHVKKYEKSENMKIFEMLMMVHGCFFSGINMKKKSSNVNGCSFLFFYMLLLSFVFVRWIQHVTFCDVFATRTFL